MRRRRSRVTYIYSPTFGGTVQSNSAALVGAGTSSPVIFDLVLNPTDSPPDVGGNTGFQRLGNRAVPDMMLDSIHGDFNWSINGAVSGQSTASGVAGVVVRGMIYIVPAIPQEGSNTLQAVFDPSSIALTFDAGDVTSNRSLWVNQARTLPGMRCVWAKTWFKVWNFGSGAGQQGFCFGGSDFEPPSTRVACKPRKRLRSTDRLLASIQYSLVSVNGFTNATQIAFTPSFRIAGHPVRYRHA